jgi:hypothetical protein
MDAPISLKRTKLRRLILALLSTNTTINFADRQTISSAAPFLAKDFHLSLKTA